MSATDVSVLVNTSRLFRFATDSASLDLQYLLWTHDTQSWEKYCPDLGGSIEAALAGQGDITVCSKPSKASRGGFVMLSKGLVRYDFLSFGQPLDSYASSDETPLTRTRLISAALAFFDGHFGFSDFCGAELPVLARLPGSFRTRSVYSLHRHLERHEDKLMALALDQNHALRQVLNQVSGK